MIINKLVVFQFWLHLFFFSIIFISCDEKQCIEEVTIEKLFLKSQSIQQSSKSELPNLIVYRDESCFYTSNDRLYNTLTSNSSDCKAVRKALSKVNTVVIATKVDYTEDLDKIDYLLQEYDVLHTSSIECVRSELFSKDLQELTRKEKNEIVASVFHQAFKIQFYVIPGEEVNEEDGLDFLRKRLFKHSKGEYIGLWDRDELEQNSNSD